MFCEKGFYPLPDNPGKQSALRTLAYENTMGKGGTYGKTAFFSFTHNVSFFFTLSQTSPGFYVLTV